ncbi:hypothetical protein [Pontibacter litorisediminis]|uniref:hypothetical protein n=1 Tax=Pontibacter litorisediminis TaxID=1846260 RepID=UPI0023EDF5E5|nr:hypothetical protein [Pontibacter litorisediminis]
MMYTDEQLEEERIRRKQVLRMVRSLEGSMRTISHVITTCSEANSAELKEVGYLVEEWVDNRLALRSRKNSDAEELEFILRGLDRFHKMMESVVSNRRLAISRNHGKAIDFTQPMYKIQTVADILKVTKPTVNNWTHSRGGYIRSFEYPGIAKFILEEDLSLKYEEVVGRTLLIDDGFREQYAYKPDPKKLKAIL